VRPGMPRLRLGCCGRFTRPSGSRIRVAVLLNLNGLRCSATRTRGSEPGPAGKTPRRLFGLAVR
jgi:hypothetical protein